MNKPRQFISLLSRISRLVNHDGHAEGLKPAQWDALRYLAQANRFSRSPGALTSYLGATKGTISQTLMSLEKKGFVVKTQDLHDKRSVALELTTAGKNLAKEDALQPFQKILSDLPANDQKDITTALEKLLLAKLRSDGNKPFGICNTCRHFRKNNPSGSPHFCDLLKEPLSDAGSEKICIEQAAI
ncbi:MarR family transcriptional regulator [Kiloniella spongiae]|uniref:MarR family transcriptional regulator n=1 Tax=Kiloniella spongiae TaxID=1489064 RepID=A0A0H2MY08_9PROT|nr:MarR family transcriptional regulator [Kiloniella spongiae]KLN61590.1 MarR family transcriptional regulator [Kiloniella spongiae]